MRLTPDTVNELLNDLAATLAGGWVDFYSDEQVLLAQVALPDPAFHEAIDGRAISRDLQTTAILATGDARTGQFVTSRGVVVGTFLARRPDEPDADRADALFDRTDFHRGGTLDIPLITLTLPQS
jgi:hypothetical protein